MEIIKTMCLLLVTGSADSGAFNHLLESMPQANTYVYYISYTDKEPVQVGLNEIFLAQVTMTCNTNRYNNGMYSSYLCDAQKVKVVKKKDFMCLD